MLRKENEPAVDAKPTTTLSSNRQTFFGHDNKPPFDADRNIYYNPENPRQRMLMDPVGGGWHGLSTEPPKELTKEEEERQKRFDEDMSKGLVAYSFR
jgi:hypothetical protein